MPVIQTNLGDVHEPKPVPPGRYALTISEAEHNEEKQYIRVSIGIDEHLDSPNVTHFISLRKPDDEDGKGAFKELMQKRFLVAFGIPHEETSFDTDEFAGATAELELTLSEPDDQNRVFNRLVLPRLMDEEQQNSKPKASSPPKRGGSKAAPKRR